MSKNRFSWEKFRQTPVIGILRGYPIELVLELAQVYLNSGYYTLEVTMNSQSAQETISSLVKSFPEMNIGAGTVCNMDDLKSALDAGATFIVMPVTDETVVTYCVKNEIPVFPGAYTPTEIYRAWHLGASGVKVFPASQLGVKYIKDVLAPLNDVQLLPTGGVSIDNIRSFFEAGVIGVGMGSSLFDKKLVEQKDWEALELHLKEIKKNIPKNA